jgi:hypothetical protein
MGAFATGVSGSTGAVTGSGTANEVAVWASASSLGVGTVPFKNSGTGWILGTGSAVAGAVLTLNSTSQGFVPPRLTAAQRTAMTGLEVGVTIFNTTQDTLNVYTAGGGTPAWAAVVTSAIMPVTFAVGDILYASSTSLLSRLAAVDTGSFLVSGGVGVAPAWSALKLPNAISANLLVYATSANTYGSNNLLAFDGFRLSPNYVTLAAGTASVGTAPLKFTSGVNLGTGEAGAMEYNGTNLFFTRLGTTRQTVLTANVVTTEVVVSDITVTVNIAGTDVKLLGRA